MQPDGWSVSTDAKSGCHHVPMHPDSCEYLALEFEGQLYVFIHLLFGLASVCKVYTAVTSEVCKPLRLHGFRLSNDALLCILWSIS